MSDWTSGYMADIVYTYGYYSELNPLRLRLLFLNAGISFPEIGTACELGFGLGMSVNFHAAASSVKWWGTDFNPAQAGFAQELAAASGNGARLFDEDFKVFCSRSDLPDFDYIGLHGIWSWISDENRAVIVDFLRQKLKVGGILYISYNTQPGWAAMAPMRNLLSQHIDVMSAPGHGIVDRINSALQFAGDILATEPAYARANPLVIERIKRMKDQNRNYLAHEYFNRDWLPMSFTSMAEWLVPAKLSFACSAHHIDHVETANLTNAQQEFLQSLSDDMFRQSVRDFMVNQQFRRDYWVKGARPLNPFDRAEQIRAQRVILTSPRSNITLKVNGSLGEAGLNEGVYLPILDLLADYKPRSIGNIEQVLNTNGLVLAQVMQAVMILTGKGDMAAVQDDKSALKARPFTDRLNAHLMNKARCVSDLNYLSSPVTAGGIPVGRFHQLFLLAGLQGKKTPEDLASFAWQLLAAQGQRLLKSGKAIDSTEDNVAELTRQAVEFSEKHLPLLKALGITGLGRRHAA